METKSRETKLIGITHYSSCTVCGGGYTETLAVLAVATGDGEEFRVCEDCLEAGNIDKRLTESADEHERNAAHLRSLVGRLVVPSYVEWKALVAKKAAADAQVKADAAAAADAEGCHRQSSEPPGSTRPSGKLDMDQEIPF